MNKTTNIVLLSTGITLVIAWWLLPDAVGKAKVKLDSGKENETEPLGTSDIPVLKEPMILENNYKEDHFIPLQLKVRGKRLYKPQVQLPQDLFYKKLQRDFETTQVTLTNLSAIAREVRLWGGNKDAPLSPALPGDVNDFTIRTFALSNAQVNAIYPQGIIVNPFNGFTYIANQLSGNVSVLNSNGEIIELISIFASGATGSASATGSGSSVVGFAVNTLESSPNYGKVYVVDCIGDTIGVIGRDLTLETAIPVGKRPIAAIFNPFNGYVYVANIADNTVSVIDTNTGTVIETIPVGTAPRAIAVIPENGRIYVVNSKDNTLSVIGPDNTVLETINIPGQSLTAITYVSDSDKMYVVAEGSNAVFPITMETNTLEAPIAVGTNPITIIYNPINTALYVGNRGDNTYTIIGSNDEIIDTIAVDFVGNGVAIDPVTNTILSSNPVRGELSLLVYSEESNQVLINEDYHSKREDFIYQPALVKHVKFILSGQERFTVLKLAKETVTGTINTRPISFSNYNSPQNFSNVAEVFEMEGTVIDGKNSWLFKIGAKQTMTILTYYKQLDRFNEPHKFQQYE